MMETVEVSDSENDEEICRKRHGRKMKMIDSDESSEDEHDVSKNEEESNNTPRRVFENSEDEMKVNKESIDIQQDHSVSEKERRSSTDVSHGSSDFGHDDTESPADDESDSGSEIERVSMNPKQFPKSLVNRQRSGSSERFEDAQAVNAEDDKNPIKGIVLVPDSETDEEVYGEPHGRQIIHRDESSKDEHAISENEEESKTPRRALKNSEDEIVVIKESVDIQEDGSVAEKERRSSHNTLDSCHDDVFKNSRPQANGKSDSGSEIERVSMNPKAFSHSDSESEEEFKTPKSTTSFDEVAESTHDRSSSSGKNEKNLLVSDSK